MKVLGDSSTRARWRDTTLCGHCRRTLEFTADDLYTVVNKPWWWIATLHFFVECPVCEAATEIPKDDWEGQDRIPHYVREGVPPRHTWKWARQRAANAAELAEAVAAETEAPETEEANA